METQTFLEHYLDYLFSLKGLLALFVGILTVVYAYGGKRKSASIPRRSGVPGCLRMGLRGKSNLEDQYTTDDGVSSKGPYVKAIYVYPIKSCRGIELPASEVSSTGLRYDRLFSFAQQSEKKSDDGGEKVEQWRFITQREYPKLALLTTELWVPNARRGEESAASKPLFRSLGQDSAHNWVRQGGCLLVRFPSEHKSGLFGPRIETVTLRIPLVPTPQRAHQKGYASESMEIWTDCPMSLNISNEIEPEALKKLERFLGMKKPLGLFRVDFDNLRGIERSLPRDHLNEKFQVGFADAFPVHLLSVASVRGVDEELPDAASTKHKLDPVRFRANIYVDDVSAYAEDEWMRIAMGRALAQDGHLGSAEYHVACRTARCPLPNVNPETGVMDRREPLGTLKRTRQVDEGAKPHPCLGLSMIPLFSQGVIRVGDEIEIVETGVHCYEKMFP